jgi:hypothetical protein
MNVFIFSIFITLGFPVAALTEKKVEPPPPEEKIENTKEISKLRTLETGIPVVLQHREPVLLPDGRVIEVYFFSHKNVKLEDLKRAQVGLKIRKEAEVEIITLTQDIDRKGRETLSTAKVAGYSLKLIKIIFDESVTIEITPE